MKTRILFVCLGNICRSPAAEEIFRTQVARQALSDSIEADSAGTYSGHAGNYETAHRLAPSRELAGKIHRMTEFCRHSPQWDHVPDPYYEGHEGFELVLDLLEDACEGLLNDLKNPTRS